MESGITTPPKMRRVAENDYEIGVNFVRTSEEKIVTAAVCVLYLKRTVVSHRYDASESDTVVQAMNRYTGLVKTAHSFDAFQVFNMHISLPENTTSDHTGDVCGEK